MRKLAGLVGVLGLLLAGCSARERAIHGDAAWRALTAPHTAVPLIAAGVIAVAGLDEDISNELAGSQKGRLRSLDFRDNKGLVARRVDAADLSVTLVETAPALWLIPTVLSTVNAPRNHCGESHYSSLKFQAILGATGATFAMNRLLKDELGVARPDGNGEGSFPSTTAALTSVAASLGRREIERMPIPRIQKHIWKTVVTAWPVTASLMRIEAKRHFATDVLVGYGIGSFWGEYTSNLADAYRGNVRPAASVRRLADGASAFRFGLRGEF